MQIARTCTARLPLSPANRAASHHATMRLDAFARYARHPAASHTPSSAVVLTFPKLADNGADAAEFEFAANTTLADVVKSLPGETARYILT